MLIFAIVTDEGRFEFKVGKFEGFDIKILCYFFALIATLYFLNFLNF